MKITDFFSPSTSYINKAVTPIIGNTEQQGQRMFQSGKRFLHIQTNKKRKERFTDNEIRRLVDTILAYIELLFGPKALNAPGKAAIWDKVVKNVNEVGTLKRTVLECKKKWSDYKRKIKKTIFKMEMQASRSGRMESMADILSKRQMNVALFFKMDAEDTTEIQTDKSLSGEGEGVSPSQNVVTPSNNIIDSEDDFSFNGEKKLSSSTCLKKNSPQDGYISQSSGESQARKQPTESTKLNTSDGSTKHEPTEPQLQLTHLDTKLDQLIVQQKNTNEILQSIHNSVSRSLDLQKKINRLLKSNFLELQKSILSTKKTTSNQSDILELTLKSLQAKLDEINNSLCAKQLQELMSSDESELDLRGTQDMTSTPVARKITQAKKRKLDQTPSPTGLPKKNKLM